MRPHVEKGETNQGDWIAKQPYAMEENQQYLAWTDIYMPVITVHCGTGVQMRNIS